MNDNALVLTQLLLQFATNIQAGAALLMKSQAEGRDVSTAELDALASKDDIEAAKLDAKILASR